MSPLRRVYHALWHIDANIRLRMRMARYCYRRVPGIGRFLGMWVDRSMLRTYGLDVHSGRVDIARLTMGHPEGVLLGGNGIVSSGRVAIMSGAKFVGGKRDDPEYMRRHAEGRVFVLGDNVMIGANSVVVGPVDICNDVFIAALSLVNRSITEPGTYAGTPVRRVSEAIPPEDYVAHMGPRAQP